MKKNRTITQILSGTKASDGDGVQLTRIIGSSELTMLDPFLLLDAFSSDKPQDYLGGFPPHPHRGFETVTYMLAGKMRHRDNAGNAGVIEAGGVQWMRAGKGIIHSEMPEQEQGLLAGFQLWVNLPATHKMDEPQYQEYPKDKIPEEIRDDSCRLKVIAGITQQGTQGIVKNEVVDPIYWDISLRKNTTFSEVIPDTHNAFIYLIEGNLSVEETMLEERQLAVLSHGEKLEQVALVAHSDCRLLLIAGKPINEPVARGGPFVMNTQEEIKQAFADFQDLSL